MGLLQRSNEIIGVRYATKDVVGSKDQKSSNYVDDMLIKSYL
jgi:hypothetical protein